MKTLPRFSNRLAFAKLDFFEKMMIVTPHEGVNIDIEEVELIIEEAKKAFGDSPFAIVSNCIVQFSVNPIAYHRFSKLPGLKAVAFVRITAFGRSNFELERKFFPSSFPVRMFDSLHLATHWLMELNLEDQ